MGSSGWADIADDLIFLLVERVVGFATFIRVSAVCKSWYTVASKTECCNSVPWLMVGEDEEGSELRDFYDHSTGEIYQLHLPQAQGCRNVGSSHGWLITASAREGDHLHLLNPITGTQINLPCTYPFPFELYKEFVGTPERARDGFITKATCSPFKPGEDYIVLATHTGIEHSVLSCCRSNDKEWFTFKFLGAIGVGFAAGAFFLISYFAEIFYIDVAGGSLLKIVNLPRDDNYRIECQCYFVECEGEVFVVEKRYTCSEIIRTKSFKVYKLYVEAKRIVEEKNIGDYAFFVGRNNSISVLITPCMKTLQKNSIYFVDDRNEQSYFSRE